MTHLLLASLFALTHVTVINVETGQLQRDVTVLIVDERIADVGNMRIPMAARVLNGEGKFVIPGLWDMHTHVPDDNVGKNDYLRLFVANGVTGIRIMEGAPEHHRWRDQIQRGELFGPRMVIASRIIDGPQSILSDAVIVKTPAEAREAVRQAKGEGADFVKVYDNLSRESYFAIVSEGHKLGLPVAGHVPHSITAAEASNAGQTSIEHLTGIHEATPTLMSLFRKNHTWQCPTLIMRHNYGVLDDTHLADDPRLKYVRRSTAERWRKMISAVPAGELQKRRETFRNEEHIVEAMQKAGVGILAGTDNGNPFCFPGFSLHDELALLVDSGLTPLQALQTATINPARFMKTLDTLGTVRKGKIADLVVLDANPLDDIHNTAKINAVVLRGRLLERNDLDATLAGIEAAANEP